MPANDCTVTPEDPAACCAPSFIFTKNGFVSVFVTSPTSVEPPPDEPPPPHAVSTSNAAALKTPTVLRMTNSYVNVDVSGPPLYHRE
ncbi:hypothetical protein Lesp01_36840 [Lentzea sp. NBRC 102530]|nr:hypothetical protein Lesp01_36840 [Lentzea sp. NBRC 102530]